MKVILLQDVRKVGKKDEIVNVSDGFGSNFLIPKKLAKLCTDNSIAELERQKQRNANEQERKKKEAEDLAKKLENIQLTFELKPGTQGRANGSISLKQVEEELLKKHNIKIDKRDFVDKRVLDCFGFLTLKIELFKNVFGSVKVYIKEKQ